jgi:hypothetical protein
MRRRCNIENDAHAAAAALRCWRRLNTSTKSRRFDTGRACQGILKKYDMPHDGVISTISPLRCRSAQRQMIFEDSGRYFMIEGDIADATFQDAGYRQRHRFNFDFAQHYRTQADELRSPRRRSRQRRLAISAARRNTFIESATSPTEQGYRGGPIYDFTRSFAGGSISGRYDATRKCFSAH